jgi:hypothetical protein
MSIEIKLEKPLGNPLSKENHAELADLDLLAFYPENDCEIFPGNLEEHEVVFWLDEKYLVVGTSIYEEEPGSGAFWTISPDRTMLTYSHVESM